jgi:hypothetical protein
MQKTDFIKCCRSVEKGAEIYLENVTDHQTGKVLFCTTDRFHVDIDGSRDSWLPQTCVKSG